MSQSNPACPACPKCGSSDLEQQSASCWWCNNPDCNCVWDESDEAALRATAAQSRARVEELEAALQEMLDAADEHNTLWKTLGDGMVDDGGDWWDRNDANAIRRSVAHDKGVAALADRGAVNKGETL